MNDAIAGGIGALTTVALFEGIRFITDSTNRSGLLATIRTYFTKAGGWHRTSDDSKKVRVIDWDKLLVCGHLSGALITFGYVANTFQGVDPTGEPSIIFTAMGALACAIGWPLYLSYLLWSFV